MRPSTAGDGGRAGHPGCVQAVKHPPTAKDLLLILGIIASAIALVWLPGCAHGGAVDTLSAARRGLSLAESAFLEVADSYCDAAQDADKCAAVQRHAADLAELANEAKGVLAEGDGLAEEVDAAIEGGR